MHAATVHLRLSPVMSGRHCFIDVIHPLGSYDLSASSSAWILEGRGLMKAHHLGLSASMSLTVHIAQLWVSGLVPIYCKKQLIR